MDCVAILQEEIDGEGPQVLKLSGISVYQGTMYQSHQLLCSAVRVRVAWSCKVSRSSSLPLYKTSGCWVTRTFGIFLRQKCLLRNWITDVVSVFVSTSSSGHQHDCWDTGYQSDTMPQHSIRCYALLFRINQKQDIFVSPQASSLITSQYDRRVVISCDLSQNLPRHSSRWCNAVLLFHRCESRVLWKEVGLWNRSVE